MRIDEFQRFLEQFGISLTKQEMQQVMKLYQNGDNNIDYDAFIRKVVPESFPRTRGRALDREVHEDPENSFANSFEKGHPKVDELLHKHK